MTIGTLDFELIAKKDQLQKSLDEAKESIKNFTDSAKQGGADAQTSLTAAASKINEAWDKLTAVGDENREAIKGLEVTYKEIGAKASAAFQKATAEGDKEFRELSEKEAALGRQIRERKKIVDEVERLTGELQKEENAYNKLAENMGKNEQRQVSFRQRTRELREEMAKQEMAAEEAGGAQSVMALHASEAYQRMQVEVARITDAMGDAQQQAKILGHDNAGLQGVISAVSGVAGAMSVAQGAVGMFAGENENLNEIMTRVQSIMAIIIGLQQVADTLNKDSAASLTIINKAREAFVTEMERGNAALVSSSTETAAETIAEKANEASSKANSKAKNREAIATQAATDAKKGSLVSNEASTAATTANTVATTAAATGANIFRRANILLSASFKAVGAAIKSVPVIGWIIAGVKALLDVIKLLTKHSREAKEEQEKYYKEVADGAKEPISNIENLASTWNGLGNDIKAKQKFVEDNASAFEKLGVKVKNVEQAENLLVKNKKAFIAAQIAKAKALAATNKAAELNADMLNKQLQMEDYQSQGKNRKAKKKQGEIKEIDAQIKDLYDRAIEAEKEGSRQLKKAGIQAANEYSKGTVGWYEKVIQNKQNALKDISDPKEYKRVQKEIANAQKTLDGITGAGNKTGSSGKDSYAEKLEDRKKQYQQLAKWANSTDEILQNAAKTQFDKLLKEGANYLDYLKKQRDDLMNKMNGSGTAAQQKQLNTINEKIADETKSTILEEFDKELERQLNGANSLLEKLSIVEKKRKELSGDGSDIDNAKSERLQNESEEIAKGIEDEYKAAQQEYYDYLEGKLTAYEKYQQDMAKLENRLASSTDSNEMGAIFKQMDSLSQRYQTQTAKSYDALAEEYATFESRKADLSKKYDEQRRLATESGDNDMLNRINESYKKDLQKMVDEYLENDVLGNALDGLDEVTVEALDKLISDIEGSKIEFPTDIKDKDIKKILKKLKDMRREIASQNPFKQLKVAFDDLKNAVSNGDLATAANAVASSMSAVGSITSQVSDAIDGLKGEAAETVKTVLDTATTVLSSASAGIEAITSLAKTSVAGEAAAATGAAAAIKTVETASVILAAIGAAMAVIKGIVKAITYFANKDKEEKLERYKTKVKELEDAYKKLEYQISRTYSSERYNMERNAIDKQKELLAEQKQRLAEMEAEKGKKGFDEEEYEALKEDVTQSQKDLDDAMDSYAEDLTQTTVPQISDDIKDALVDAFANGMSDSEINKTIEKLVDDMMKNAAIHFAETDLLTPAITEWYDNFKKAIEGDGKITDEERQQLQQQAMDATLAFKERVKEINEMFSGTDTNTSTLSGALKGASQESIDLLAGYTNATRILESQQLAVLERQLTSIASIDGRVARAVEILDGIRMRMGATIVNNTTTFASSQVNNERSYGLIEN